MKFIHEGGEFTRKKCMIFAGFIRGVHYVDVATATNPPRMEGNTK